jgi:hypothetical protein
LNVGEVHGAGGNLIAPDFVRPPFKFKSGQFHTCGEPSNAAQRDRQGA